MVQLWLLMLLRFFGAALLPMKAVRLQLGELLAADTTTLAPAADANKIALIKANFTPQENLIVADLTLADFDGSTPLEGATGTQQAGIAPLSGQQVVTIIEPVGGWRWETTGVTNLPQTIYGYALLNDAGTVLLGVAKLPTAIPLTAAGQEINLGAVSLTLLLQPMS